MESRKIELTEPEAHELVRLLNLAVKYVGLDNEIALKNAIHFKEKIVRAFEPEQKDLKDKKDVGKK